MKNSLKKLIALILSALMILTLSGCDIVGEARKTHAITMEKDGVSGLKLGEQEYLLLPYDERLSPICTNLDVISLTEPDVPVLLSTFFGTPYNISDDGVFIYDWEGSSIYCRADKYNELLQTIEGDMPLTEYCYTYYSFDESTYSDIEKRIIMSQDEVNALISVLSNVTPVSVNDLDYMYILDIYACSSDTLFMEHCAELIVDSNDLYSLVVYGNGGNLQYNIPDKEAEVLSKIAETVINSDPYFYEEY